MQSDAKRCKKSMRCIARQKMPDARCLSKQETTDFVYRVYFVYFVYFVSESDAMQSHRRGLFLIFKF